MWPGIRPATGWIAYLTSTPRSSRSSAELAARVLRLGDGEAVARDDDHVLRVRELDRGIVRADLPDGAAGTAPWRPPWRGRRRRTRRP